MPRKKNIDIELKSFDSVTITMSRITLRESSELWGTKARAARKGFESYMLIRRYLGKQFSVLFTEHETELLLAALPYSPSILVQFLPAKNKILELLTTFSSSRSCNSCKNKINSLSEVELAFLLIEIERIELVRSYYDAEYLSFTESTSAKQ